MSTDSLKNRLEELFSSAAAEQSADGPKPEPVAPAEPTPQPAEAPREVPPPETKGPSSPIQTSGLLEREEILGDLFENANVLVQSVSVDGTFLYVNRTWKRSLGYTDEDLRRLSLFDVIHPDSQAHCSALFAQVTEGKNIDHMEATFLARDGRAVMLEGSTSCSFKDGKPFATRGIFTDVTRHKQAETELRKLSRAVEQSPSVVVITDTEGRIEYVNPALTQLTGYTTEEALGMNVANLGDQPEEELRQLWQTLSAGREWHGQFHNRKKSGERYWVSASISAVRDAAGGITHYIALEEDITERHQAEEALSASESKYRALFNNIVDPVVIVDRETKRFLDCNQAMQDRYGYTLEELRSMTLHQLHPSEDVPEVAEYLDDRSETFAHSYMHVTKAGERLFVEIRTAEVEYQDRPAWISILHDVTARKREEAEYERRTVQLHTAAEVSRAASSILKVDELLSTTVDLIRDGFDLYYVGLFLVDESRRNAVLRAGTGEAGRIMLARGHQLAVGGASMIGWCVENQEARIALDVGEEAVRFDNPVLPETHSELALPLVSRGQTLGAMTVQSAQASAFSQADVAVLQTMADQIAIAISNAQLFEQTQQRAAREAELNRIAENLRRAGDIDTILRVAAEELGQSLRASHASARLGGPAALSGGHNGQS